VIKILNIIENLDDTYGGPAKSVPYMCKYLSEENLDTDILSIKLHKKEENVIVKKYNLNWKTFDYIFSKKFRYSLGLKSYITDLAKNEKKLILHNHNLWNYISYISYRISKKHKTHLVTSIRGSLYQWSLNQSIYKKKLAWIIFQKKALENASCIHVTEINELKAVRELGIKTPIALIPNGINLNEFSKLKSSKNAKESLNLETKKKYILFMSRLHPKKGLEYLVNSWIDLANNYKEWILLIVGPEYDKEYVNNIKTKIHQSGIQNRVIFKGMLEGQNRLDAFASSNLFVLPSHSENFGISIAEAMASKIPVITTHGTPWSEINDYKSGWWVELTKKNIHDALNSALKIDQKELDLKGLKGYKLIQKYEWKYQANKMKDLYEYLINNGSKPDFIYEYGDHS
jgi:glycosyltransferase involved in cell wall biosynthesis